MTTLSSSLIPSLIFLLLVGSVIGAVDRELQDDSTTLAEAFLCDADFNELSPDEVFNKKDKIRICVKTHVRAKVQGISIAKVIDFFLLREFGDGRDMEQILLKDGVAMSSSDELTCQPGSELCILESIPMDDFFGRDGKVSVIGSVLLQHDTSIPVPTATPTPPETSAPSQAPTRPETPTPSQTLAPTESSAPSDTNPPTEATDPSDTISPQNVNRNMIRMMQLLDSREIVETSFTVATAGSGIGIISDFREHWDASPTFIRVLYVFAFIFLFLFLFGMGIGLLAWAGFCTKKSKKLPERYNIMSRKVYGTAKHRKDRSYTMAGDGESNRRHDDQYDDEPEPTPKQIFISRPISSSRSGDIEAPGEDTVAGRKRKPRVSPADRIRISARERNSERKANISRNCRSTAPSNRDMAAIFFQKFPKKKIATVRAKTPRTVDKRNREVTGNVEGGIPREKTASGVPWLQEKQRLQGSTRVAGLAPRRGGIVLQGNAIPKKPQSAKPDTVSESSRRVQFDVESQHSRENPRPID